jgi:hypothetical protein
MSLTDLNLAEWAGLLGGCLAAVLAADLVLRAATDRLTARRHVQPEF